MPFSDQKVLRNALILCAPSLFLVQIASATVVRTIPSDQAQGMTGEAITADVASGVGLNISFIQTGEVVKKAWIDDPSRITLSFDGTLCQPPAQDCSSDQGATVVHLRQIRPIHFPDLPRSSSSGTLLTLITEGSEGRKLYQFRVRSVTREPKYTTIAVRPTVSRTSAMALMPQPQPSLPFSKPVEPTRKAESLAVVPFPQIASDFQTFTALLSSSR